jgi:hypothetical protein
LEQLVWEYQQFILILFIELASWSRWEKHKIIF